MLAVVKKIIDFISKLFKSSNKSDLDNKIVDKKNQVKRIENEARDINDIINDLNNRK